MRDADRYTYGRADSWDPASYPRTVEQARSRLGEWTGESTFVLSGEAFERVLQGGVVDELRGPFRDLLQRLAAGTPYSRLSVPAELGRTSSELDLRFDEWLRTRA